jgi:lipoate-protein ligase A
MKIIDSGSQSGKDIMNRDETLLEELQPNGAPLLHFYRFQKKSATFGHFLSPEDYIDLPKAEALGFAFAKRPTGGGMIFHIWDLPFSLLIPANHPGYFQDPLKNYAFIHQIVLQAIGSFLENPPLLHLLPEEPLPLDQHTKAFCMAKPTKYDIMIDGKKIVGAAQRRKKQGYLHQGSISLAMPNFEEIASILRPGTQIIEAMRIHTASLLGAVDDPHLFKEAQEKLKKELIKAVTGFEN